MSLAGGLVPGRKVTSMKTGREVYCLYCKQWFTNYAEYRRHTYWDCPNRPRRKYGTEIPATWGYDSYAGL